MCVWAISEGGLEMGVSEYLGPRVKWFKGWYLSVVLSWVKGLKGECLQVSGAQG